MSETYSFRQAVAAACQMARGQNTDGKSPIIVGVIVDKATFARLGENELVIMTVNGTCRVVEET